MQFKNTFFSLLICTILCIKVGASVAYWTNNYDDSNVEIENCGDPEYVFQQNSLEVTPKYVTPGGQVNISVTGYLSETVYEGAYAHVTVKLGLIVLLRKTFDICRELEKHKNDVHIQCPVERGDLKIFETITLPKQIPHGVFRVLVDGYTEVDEPLACFKIKTDFLKKRPSSGQVWIQQVDGLNTQ